MSTQLFNKGAIKFGSLVALSIAVHVGVAYAFLNPDQSQKKINTGSIAAPVTLSFSTVQQTAVEPVQEKPKLKPEPKPVIEKKSEPVIKPKPKPVQKVESEPKPVEPKKEEVVEQEEQPPKEPQQQESQPEMVASAKVESQAPGLNEIPVITEPSFLSPPKPPTYPRQARRRNQQGTAYVEALVGEDGKTQNVEIYESSGFPLLDRAAVQAVMSWELKPKIVGGKAVLSKVRVPVHFNLRRS